MATRAATFTSKIRTLREYHNKIINNVAPLPTGIDIANTLKYFSQTLLSVLKDVPNIPAESYSLRQKDSVRLSIFPTLNYSDLYQAVLSTIDLVPVMQIGQLALGEAVLNVLGWLVPFLEHDLLDALPYTVASTLAIFPPTLHKDTIDLLCGRLLPMTLSCDVSSEPTYASESAAAIITMVFQHTENGAFHSQILECFMSNKKNVIKDVLSIIAYGPPTAKAPAAHLLFYYWPQLNPALSDRRGIHYKYCAWPAVLCQRKVCINEGSCQAVKMCINPALAIHSGDTPPPLYICSDCVQVLRAEHGDYMVDLLMPMPHVSSVCENKNCKSSQNIAVSTCFSIECASYNNNRPIRYCEVCNERRHGNSGSPDHIYHTSITDIWSCTPEVQRYLMDAIVSLLKEASPIGTKRMVEMGEDLRRVNDDEEGFDMEDSGGERKLLSRYGIWLLVELCKPADDIPIEVLGRLLGMLFQWFDATAYLPDDNVGNALERLKPEYVYSWLQEVMKTHFEVIVSCLLPHPVEYSRVGGFWDTLCTRTTQIKEGLNCFFCLVPYNIITFEIWDYVMPYWLEAIRTEVPEDELHELKVLLSKAFDIDMCPLPFTLNKMYNFVSDRFDDVSASVMEQALQWLQILGSLDIVIPIHQILNMFKCGVDKIGSDVTDVSAATAAAAAEGAGASPGGTTSTGSPSMRVSHDVDEFGEHVAAAGAGNSGLFGHGGSESGARHAVLTPGSPVREHAAPLSPERFPNLPDLCEFFEKESELVLPCFIMMLDLCLKQMNLQESPQHLGIYNEMSREVMSLLSGMLHKPWDGKHTCSTDTLRVNCVHCQNVALWHQLASQLMEHVCPRDPLKIPHKDLPKVDDQHNKPQSQQQPPIAEATNEGTFDLDDEEKEDPTFDVSAMPMYLQLYDALLESLVKESDVDALYAILSSMRYLILHGECLNYTINQYTEFITHSFGRRFIPTLWKLLQCEHSQLATLCIPLLLHCITLPMGSRILWFLVERDFGHDDWRARFAAVEKVTMMARCLEPEVIRNNHVIQTSLAHAFCHLIGSVEDINASVAQRAIMFLETIRPAALKCLCCCLEFQFDSVIEDRSLILHRVRLLETALKDVQILTWDFFLSRFDTLSLEAQVDLESSGDIPYLTDLPGSDRQSEHFQRKLNRARFALARTDSVRSVSQSMKGRPPYRRAVSVPLHLITKGLNPPKYEKSTSPPVDKHSKSFMYKQAILDKEKPCVRQWSAPQFNLPKRMPSKLNLGTGGSSTFPSGQLREFTDEESNFAALLQRAVDLEGLDRDTVYQLVSLLMMFMVQLPDKEEGDVKPDLKAQNIVLRHLNVLLGYNQTEKSFSVPPYKLRSSAVFNAFLSGVMYVLDRNFKLGYVILPITLLVLQYCPSPQRYASDYQPPTYTLWYLEPHTRVSWLKSLLVILYKYQISTSPRSAIIQTLVQLVTNTIDAQHHRCKKTEDGLPPPSPTVHRSKDFTKISVSDLENIQETETPPQSPSSQAQQAYSGDDVEDHNVQLKTHPSGAAAHYFKRVQTDTADSSEGMVSDADVEGTQTSPFLASLIKKDMNLKRNTASSFAAIAGIGSISKTARQPRRLIEYSEPESADDDSKNSTERSDAPLLSKKYHQDRSHSAIQAVSVEGKMDQQLREFSAGVSNQSHVEGSERARDVGATSDHSREGLSDAETSDDTEKSQTSDGDSGGEGNFDEPKEDDTPAERKLSPLLKPNFRQRRPRKTGLTTIDFQRKFPELREERGGLEESASQGSPAASQSSTRSSWRKSRKAELLAKHSSHHQQSQSGANKKASSGSRYSGGAGSAGLASGGASSTAGVGSSSGGTSGSSSETVLVERCSECGAALEQYDDDTIGLCITALAAFTHREPGLATPMLPDMLHCVARIAAGSLYSWQAESNVIIPGNCISIARQFLRCVLHQLAPNGIFPMVFQSNMEDPHFWKTMASALVDFNDLPAHAPLQFLLEGLNERKNLPQDTIMLLLNNMATYLNCISLESSLPTWTAILTHFDTFLRRLPSVLPNPCDAGPIFKIMITLLKVHVIGSVRAILEPFSKIMSFAIQNCSFKLQQLLDVCVLCTRALTRERDKMLLTRTVIYELVQAIKFKSSIPDENLLLLVQFVVLDAGGTLSLYNSHGTEAGALYSTQSPAVVSTSAAEAMRQHLNDCLEFIADLHTINKVKTNMKVAGASLNEDTLGSQLKSGISQYLALEITRGNGRDARAITRYLPWLYHPPSAMQQGPKEFLDCIGHIRLMSWLLIGSLTHTAVTEGAAPMSCLPVPLEASCHIADHIMVIMTGFAEQSKQTSASVLHMSSLFHAFILCQLWTMYSESAAALHSPGSDQHQIASAMIMDFWARVTPGILQLLSHSKELAEMVNLHFLGLMEALQECNSSVLAKLFPMWTSILFAYQSQLPGHQQVRLQTCQNWEPPHPTKDQTSFNSSILLSWLKRIQFKLGQMEVQSSAVTQIYIV